MSRNSPWQKDLVANLRRGLAPQNQRLALLQICSNFSLPRMSLLGWFVGRPPWAAPQTNSYLSHIGVCLLLAASCFAGSDLRLLDAVKRRDHKSVTSLVRERADVNAAQPDGATALAWAVH